MYVRKYNRTLGLHCPTVPSKHPTTESNIHLGLGGQLVVWNGLVEEDVVIGNVVVVLLWGVAYDE